MAGDGERLNPGAVAQRVGLASSTLRIYSVKLAGVLSAGAGRPIRRGDGRPGVRTYSPSDVAMLMRAKELLGKGLTYEDVAAELSGQQDGAEKALPRHRRNSVASLGGALGALGVALERAMAATDGWQRLAEEREREVCSLRGRVDRLESLLDARREAEAKAWWRRLFA